MKRQLILAAWLGVGALLAPRLGSAQSSCNTNSSIRAGSSARTCTISVGTPNTSSYTNPMLVRLTSSPAMLTFAVDEAAYEAGATEPMPLSIQVTGNRSWVVTASGPAFWTASGEGAWSAKPVSTLLWSNASHALGTPLSSTAATIAFGSAGESAATIVYWHALLDWTTDKPGSYSLPVTLTLTAP